MKRKFYSIFLMAPLAIAISACGGESEQEEESNDETTSEEVEEIVEEVIPTFEDNCTSENNIELIVEDYESSLKDPWTYNGTFDALRTEWEVLSDSTAELKIFNYSEDADILSENKWIYVMFNTKYGEPLQAGEYNHEAYTDTMWCKTNLMSPIGGTVWFNWETGMPEKGTVSLNYFDDNRACGEFNLEVNKPENKNIGHVSLKGTWVAQ